MNQVSKIIPKTKTERERERESNRRFWSALRVRVGWAAEERSPSTRRRAGRSPPPTAGPASQASPIGPRAACRWCRRAAPDLSLALASPWQPTEGGESIEQRSETLEMSVRERDCFLPFSIYQFWPLFKRLIRLPLGDETCRSKKE